MAYSLLRLFFFFWGGGWNSRASLSSISIHLLLQLLSLLTCCSGASATAAVGVLLTTVGLLYNGTRIRSPDALLASNEIEIIAAGNVQGLGFVYHLEAPNEHWFLRTDAVAKQDNPLADRWLVRPDRDAHFLVVAEQFPASNIDVALYETAVVDNLEAATKSFEVLESKQLWEHDPQSRLVRARALIQGLNVEYAYGIVVFEDLGFQLIGFASQTEFPAVEAELRAIHDSIVIGAR